MARNPDETKFQLQRDRMLKAAAYCFNQQGDRGPSLKDVAHIRALTDAALYDYVRNKEELVYQCYVRADIEDIKDTVKDYDIIVNATSVGLKNESSVIELKGINEKTIVYDIVYMPMNTDFIKKAKAEKAIIIYGYEMLLGQAVRAFEIWHGIEAPYNAMKKALLGGF